MFHGFLETESLFAITVVSVSIAGVSGMRTGVSIIFAGTFVTGVVGLTGRGRSVSTRGDTVSVAGTGNESVLFCPIPRENDRTKKTIKQRERNKCT